MGRVLYLFTGTITALTVGYALLWAGAVYAPVSVREYICLFGSVCLIVAAFTERPHRRLAARIALIGLAAIWSFYIPAINGIVRIRLTDQRLLVRVLMWAPSTSPLKIINKENIPNLSSAEVKQLRAIGIGGTISYDMGANAYGSGTRTSEVMIIMQRPVTAAVGLREPEAGSVVYLQGGDGWRMFPPTARTLARTISIQPDAQRQGSVEIAVELSSGVRQGFSVWNFPAQAKGGK
jgi:hypothetical protein